MTKKEKVIIKVQQLHDQGMSVRDIAAELEMPKSTVADYIQRLVGQSEKLSENSEDKNPETQQLSTESVGSNLSTPHNYDWTHAIQITNGMAVTSSRTVAAVFGKQHKNVLRDIEELLPKLSDEFRKTNYFMRPYYDSQGKKQPRYIMTRDGMTMLVMAYNTPTAIMFREWYIKMFNQMEHMIKQQYVDSLLYKQYVELTGAIVSVYKGKTKKELINDLEKYTPDVLFYLRSLSYEDYLNTEYWQLIRQKKLLESDFQCSMCDSITDLNVHHRIYTRNGESIRGIERMSDLMVLCRNCHNIFHMSQKLNKDKEK